jgi:hypothetical protein
MAATTITYSCVAWVPRGAPKEQPDLYEGAGDDAKALYDKVSAEAR